MMGHYIACVHAHAVYSRLCYVTSKGLETAQQMVVYASYVRLLITFDVGRSVHHHTIQIN